ncbi:hypothetical protein HDV00_004076 [Rhizophlyctis rosea]|nr:hypothetical protein HDV00_004076 [Rhizophlyctis rosea]
MNAIANIFQDASKSTSTHRKNIVAMRKLHVRTGDSMNKDTFKCLCRVLTAKRGNAEAERVVKFLVTYLESSQSEEGTPQTLALSLTEYLLKALRHGLRAGDKIVRYRSCQIIGNLLNVLEEMDDDMYDALIPLLLERAKDKEALVRSSAVTALSRLQGCGKTDEEDAFVRETLLDMVRHDPSPDVRKVALWNIGEGADTLAYIIERSRDTDANVRKFVYSKIQNDYKGDDLNDDDRDQLLHNGLSDRDSGVKKASLKLLNECWLSEGDQDIVDFLRKLNVMDGLAAEETVRAFLVVKPDVKFPFDESIWDGLDMETAFFLRVYIQHCIETERDDDLDEALPPLLKHVQLLTRLSNVLSEEQEEDAIMVYEFLLAQLLKIAEVQDFSDEIGRRNMLVCLRKLTLLGDMMCNIELGDNLLSAVKTIRKLATNEQEFMRFMVEEVLRNVVDLAEEGAQGQEAMPAEVRQAVTLSKCLDIIKCIMQCAEGSLNENVFMGAILQDFVGPALQHSNAVIRGAGLHCLGLCSLADKALAQQQMPLYAHASKTSEDMACLVLRIYFDLVITHGAQAFWDSEESQIPQAVNEFLQCESEAILTMAVEGMAKLFMLSYVKIPELLQKMIFLYFHPYTKGMERLRQCLSYFFPVFSHSSHRNQKLIRQVFMPSFDQLLTEAESAPSSMLSPMQIAQQLIDWTDVRKVVRNENGEENEIDEGLHADVAIDILQAAISEDDAGIKKLYCQMLNKLYLGPSLDPSRAKSLAVLVGTLKEHVAGSAVVANALKKFANQIVVLDGDNAHSITDKEHQDLAQQWRRRSAESAPPSDSEPEKDNEEEDDEL